MIKNIKARLTAKRYNIWTDRIDKKRRSDFFLAGDFISADGSLYYGHPLLVFFYSANNAIKDTYEFGAGYYSCENKTQLN